MQHHLVTRPPATRPVAIEVAGEPVGVVVPPPQGYRFLAVRLAAFGSDGRIFDSIESAQVEIARQVTSAHN